MSRDDDLRTRYENVPVPAFPSPAFTPAGPLPSANVAIVTSAALQHAGDDGWSKDETGFRQFAREDRDLLVGHLSANFDRTGISADLNVAYPIDRLLELEADGIIGGVAPRHISFVGSTDDLSTIIQDTGPAAAQLLLDDGVQVVLLTSVCPLCPRLVCTLGHVLEANGLSTVVFATNEGLARRMAPPRALFCEFPFGRPLGKPRDPEFQRQVLLAGLSLLDRQAGPVFERFPEVINDEGDLPTACPMPAFYDPKELAVVAEAKGLRRAYDRAVLANGGRTQVGRVLSPDQVPEALERFARMSEGEPWAEVGFTTDAEMANSGMDIRAYYEEAAIGLSDHVPATRASESWMFQQTEAGRVLRTVLVRLQNSPDPALTSTPYVLVPLSYWSLPPASK